MRRLWQDYSLSIVLGILFVSAWVLQTITGWVEFQAEQQAHGELAGLFGANGYVWSWARTTMENWQSEFLQLLTFVVLTSFLIHRGSHESKDSDEEIHAKLTNIERELASLQARLRPRSGVPATGFDGAVNEAQAPDALPWGTARNARPVSRSNR